jgi:tetratricopeptide (TPR) repeat protein
MMPFLILFAVLAQGASPSGPARFAPGAFERSSEDYGEFIAGEAQRLRAAVSTPGETLGRVLGVEDLLAARSKADLRAAAGEAVVSNGTRKTPLVFRGPTGVFEAMLLAPAEAPGRLPAVLLVPGSRDIQLQAWNSLGRELSLRGYVVIVAAPVRAAEPGQEFDDAFNLLLLGRTSAGLRVYEQVLLLDYLQSLPSVDGGRLAIMGLGEGSVTAGFTAKLDGRVRAAVFDADLRKEPYYDWSASLLVPGLLTAARSQPRVPTLLADPRRLDAAQAAGWLEPAFKGEAPTPKSRDEEADLVEAVFKSYKGYPPGGQQSLFHYNLSMSYRKRALFREAIEELEKAIRLEPHRAYMRRSMAELHRLIGRPDLVEKDLEAMLAPIVGTSNEMWGRFDLGDIHEQQGHLEKARREYIRALELDPSQPQRLKLAQLHERLGETAEAKLQYQELIARLPYLVEHRVNFGKLLLRIGDVEGAGEQFSRAISHAPGLEPALLAMAELHESRGKWEEAQAEYERILKFAPGSTRARMGLSRNLLKQGHQGRARKELMTAAASDAGVEWSLRRSAELCRADEELLTWLPRAKEIR